MKLPTLEQRTEALEKVVDILCYAHRATDLREEKLNSILGESDETTKEETPAQTK